MTYIKVKGHDHLIRDPKTNSIININNMEYNEYIARKESKIKDTEKIDNLESDINNIKSDINEIKSLLKNLVGDSN
jgi:hypothetical protein